MITNFKDEDGVDLGSKLVPKSYLIDRYPDLADTFRFAGLWSWGYNNKGQLGDGTITHRSSPVPITGGGTNWKLISCGRYHTAAIKTDGTLWLWGYNNSGQLGDNTTIRKSSPVSITGGGTNWKSISGGFNHTAAIKTDGTLWLWGWNGEGELGDNSVIDKSSPVPIAGGGTNWKQVDSGGWHTAAIKTDGTLWSWGHNNYGQLGDNTITHRSSPVPITGGGTNWKLANAGKYHTVAIKTDGTLWAWGHNSSGQLGYEDIVHRSSPVPITGGGTNWKQVDCGDYYTVAIKTDGTLCGWGYNIEGQLGDNTIVNKSSPVPIAGGGTNWKQVDSSGWHTAAIKTDGTLWLWGWNVEGELGDNSVIDKSSPVPIAGGGTNWKLVNGGGYHTLAIRDESEDLI